MILALGHSARDTFHMLYDREVAMIQKAFSIGIRIEHPQALIDESQYGTIGDKKLGAADYKLSGHFGNGRSAYTFCMCPGGEVVAAASEENKLVTNGMSYHAREGENANSALLVGITPEDFDSEHPLAGIEYQRDEKYESNIKGIYPIGEGAGYAGGIISAAVDGIRIAEQIAKE